MVFAKVFICLMKSLPYTHHIKKYRGAQLWQKDKGWELQYFAPAAHTFNQGLLKLLWTVYSEEKLQSCLKLRIFQNPFNKGMSVGLQDIPRTKKA